MRKRTAPLILSLIGACALTACGGQSSDTPPSPTAVVLATGSGVTTLPNPAGPFFYITSYGAVSNGAALTNQSAINAAIAAASAVGGGTVVVPSGNFKTYTIHLMSNVGLHLESATSVLRAAIQGTGTGQDGGFYDAPERNPFVGLQDEGHSHWNNSLIVGNGVDHVMISGPGLIDGSYLDTNGLAVNVLSGNDVAEVTNRAAAGTPGLANKAIALKNATNIVFRDFSIRNGGHFGILGSGVIGWTIDNIIVDGNRDAIDIDCSQNMTIRNSVFNSLTDDAIVVKSSFGLGRYQPAQNILIENDTVSGYDAGSVIDKVYSSQKIIATDTDGPTGRIKLGTEGTTGFNTITVRNVTFDRSRGFALESVDGADLHDIVLQNATMRNISSSPIYLRLGDRGRNPVTGITSDESVSPTNTVRLDDRGFVLPNLTAIYGSFPTVRTIPSYARNSSVAVGGGSTFNIVNPATPTVLNPFSTSPADPLAANAVGIGYARVRNIKIDNVTVDEADPRYPILIQGLVNHPIENVQISNVTVNYRGGLSLQDAVEQRQLNQSTPVTPYLSATINQNLPFFVNTFFSLNESLLPRVSWDATANSGAGGWAADPYNVPEMPRDYPEPSELGILPAYGLYARHVTGMTITNVKLHMLTPDGRAPVVLDDVANSQFSSFTADAAAGVPVFVEVTNTRKRNPVEEYVKDRPFSTTTVSNVTLPSGLAVSEVTVNRPAPGTPNDTLYSLPTAPSTAHPYSFAVANAAYPKPLTIYRPTFDSMATRTATVGTALSFTVNARTPVAGQALTYAASNLPAGATFDVGTKTFNWTPTSSQAGATTVSFTVNDGVLPVTRQATIIVTP